MTDDEKTGLFTYESYLEHLQRRKLATRAEMDGFMDAGFLKCNPPNREEDMRDPVYRNHHFIGLSLGQLYLKKKEQGT